MRETRMCVYTALTGRYEQLNEQPIAAQSRIPFICLTDDPDLRSGSWQVRQIRPKFGMDPIRSQRDLKLSPHLHLPEFDASLYIDNSVLLSELPERLFEDFEATPGFCLAEHSFRNSVLDEFLAVAESGLDDQSRIFEQLNHYLLDCPEVLDEKPYWGAILMRDHRSSAVRVMLEAWLAHVNRYSRRDQLSVNAAFRYAGLKPQVLRIDNHSSWFHSWPHARSRDQNRGTRRPATSLSPPAAHIRRLEQALAEQARQHEQALAEQSAYSTSRRRPNRRGSTSRRWRLFLRPAFGVSRQY